MQAYRKLILIVTIRFIWYGAFSLFFIYSGAQNILGNPELQSGKFIKAFIETEPLPRMASYPFIVWIGVAIISILHALVYLMVRSTLKGNWLIQGLQYGLILWMVMIPWFEFYLPYNVMNEPMNLVLFEGLLWLGVLLAVGIYCSLVVSCQIKKPQHSATAS